MLSERNQTQKVTNCTVNFPFIRSVQMRQICRKRKQISGYQGMGGGANWESLLNGYGVFFWDNLKVLKLERSGGCTTS